MPRALKADIKRADIISAFFEATKLAGFSDAEAARLFGRPRGFVAQDYDLDPMPANDVQDLFLARFRAIEAERLKPELA